jgi:hypothetical protein
MMVRIWEGVCAAWRALVRSVPSPAPTERVHCRPHVIAVDGVGSGASASGVREDMSVPEALGGDEA